MLKYASVQVLDARMGKAPNPRVRTAHRVEFNYTPRPGYLYVRSRMISSRCNDNFDEFTSEEIRGDGRTTGYVTFVGKPVFVNHMNEDHRRMRGIILDAKLHEDTNPDGSPDTWVEGLMEIDAMRFPKLAKAVLAGEIDRTSMGVDVAMSQCSKCGNKATTPLEYCGHIPAMKGRKIRTFTASGTPTDHLIRERCHGLRFFENSLLVEEPADPTAFLLGSPVEGPSMSRTASKQFPASDFHSTSEDASCSRWNCNGSAVAYRNTGQGKMYACSTHKDEMTKESAMAPVSRIPYVEGVRRCAVCYSSATVLMGSLNECTACGSVHSVHADIAVFAAAAPGGEHEFFKQHPVHHSNAIDHWKMATADEKVQGKRWYPDSNLVAQAMGSLYKGEEHPRGNTHLAAGVLANYSSQTPWDANKHNAARVLHEGRGLGGPGGGILADEVQRKKADRMLSGESHEDVISPKGHKTRAFAHLIEHGGDADPNNPRVCVDRHALSVAAGKRLSDAEYGAFPKSAKQHYEHVAKVFHEASSHISEMEGEHVPPHAVQATTWLVRQRLNQQEESKDKGTNNERLNKGRSRSRENQSGQWNDFRQQHLKDTEDNSSTGYSDAQSRRRDRTNSDQS